MAWLQFIFPETNEDKQELLVGLLSVYPFEAFENSREGLLAYVQETKAKDLKLEEELSAHFPQEKFRINLIPEENWNAKWESSFAPVVIEDQVGIRAGFHKPLEVKFELIIEPKMSFGTGHHPTTAGVVSLMLSEKLKGKTVLDVGSGTGLLAILAEKMGAVEVVGVDNDPWCEKNFTENIRLNEVKHVRSVLGTISDIPVQPFGMVIANINRNVLLEILSDLSSRCAKGGVLILSGFYLADKDILLQSAKENGFELSEEHLQNDWLALKFSKA
jgi:ribosomal protein L11 methyltransferase